MLEFDASPEDLKVFLDEAEEQLQIMEEDIVKLERSPGDEALLQEIFRAAHTLKGSSATLGHSKMAELTHHMESVLDRVRRGRIRVDARVVDALFQCLDVLKAFKDEIATGQESGVEVRGALLQLGSLEEPAGETAAAAVETPTYDPECEVRLRRGQEQGLSAWWAAVTLDRGGPMPAVRAFQVLVCLGELGEVVRSWPDQEAVEQDRVGAELRVLLLTAAGPEAIEAALAAVPEVSVVEIRAVDWAPDAQAGADPAAAAVAEGGPQVRRTTHTVRVDVQLLDELMNLVGELVIDRTRLAQLLGSVEHGQQQDHAAADLAQTSAHIGRVTAELQEKIMRARMLPVESLFKKFPRLVRDVANRAGKDISFVMRGEDTELDRSVIEEIGDPLMHLLRNCIDHGIEPADERLRQGKPPQGTVTLAARHEENHIVITVRDDGRGIDAEKIRRAALHKGLMPEDALRRLADTEAVGLIFHPGFSTAERVSDISGRGVGMDVVQKNIERVSGTIEVHTEVGRGTEFRIKLPLTLAIIRALLVEVAATVYAVPLGAVTETIRIPATEIQMLRRQEVVVYRGSVVPLLRLEEVFASQGDAARDEAEVFVVITSLFGKQVGLVVDRLVGEQEVVIKSLGRYIGEVSGLSGATILGDGDVAIILDVAGLIGLAALGQTA